MTTVSDFIIDRLIEWDLHRFYGFPGDGIGGFDGALERAERAGKDFRYIRPVHEETASLMACAHAKFTGEVGVCISTSGPGAIHMMNGLYDAYCDNQPVVAIVGQQGQAAMGSDFQQELNMERIFGDVAEYTKTVTTPMQAQLVIDRAVRLAKAYRRPTVVILPADVQNFEMEEPTLEHWVSRTGVGHASTAITPPEDELRRAAEVLNEGSKVAMLVGQGALGRTRRGRRGRGAARGRDHHRAAGQGRGRRRRPVPHPAAGPARFQAQLGHDPGLRHAAHGRDELPLRGVPPARRTGARGADRPHAPPPEPALPDGGEPLG